MQQHGTEPEGKDSEPGAAGENPAALKLAQQQATDYQVKSGGQEIYQRLRHNIAPQESCARMMA